MAWLDIFLVDSMYTVAVPHFKKSKPAENMKCLAHHGWAFLLYVLFFLQVEAMFQKRSRDHRQEDEDPQKRLRADVSDLFLSNDVSAQRAHRIMQGIDDCKVPGFRKLATAGDSGSRGATWPET